MPADNVRTKQLEGLRLSDFDKYRLFAQRWLKRRNEKRQQDKVAVQSTPSPGVWNGHGEQGVQQRQKWDVLRDQLQQGAHLPIPQAGLYPQQHYVPAGVQQYGPAQVRLHYCCTVALLSDNLPSPPERQPDPECTNSQWVANI